MPEVLGPGLFVIFVLGIVFISTVLKIMREYERAVVFRLGRLSGVRGPGIIFLLPFGIDRPVRVDLRVITMDVPKQELMTKDNVPASVDAVVYFQVVDPAASVVKIENFVRATSMIAQTTLRSVVGQSELDELLSHREKVNQQLQTIIDQATEPWGVKVVSVEVRDVALPDSMKRAMARQAEVERERRAKVISAEGEFQASQRLAEAAHIINTEPIALQLRYLQTVAEIATEKNSTTLFPIPIDLLSPFLELAKKKLAE